MKFCVAFLNARDYIVPYGENRCVRLASFGHELLAVGCELSVSESMMYIK